MWERPCKASLLRRLSRKHPQVTAGCITDADVPWHVNRVSFPIHSGNKPLLSVCCIKCWGPKMSRHNPSRNSGMDETEVYISYHGPC